jgi:UDP-glucose 4-epimerase
MQTFFVTGSAGFIGSNLVDELLSRGHRVVGWDNFTTGRWEFLRNALKSTRFRLLDGDNLDLPGLTAAMDGCDFVFHLAANADVRFGLEHPSKDLEQNTHATFNVLEGMRANGIRGIGFSSTGSVYGEAEVIPTPEHCAFPYQTSLYGASKLACEGLIQAYCEGFGMKAHIFRFVSILGPRYTHGHVIDFYEQLLQHPSYLDVLGDGNQRKSYLYVGDCVQAMLHLVEQDLASQSKHAAAVYNLGTDEHCAVRQSIEWICGQMEVSPRLNFSGGNKGWIGDNPFIYLDTTKIRATGWRPEFTIRQGVEKTVEWLRLNPWVLEKASGKAFARSGL